MAERQAKIFDSRAGNGKLAGEALSKLDIMDPASSRHQNSGCMAESQEGQVSLVLERDMMARVLIILFGMLLDALGAYGLFWIAGMTFGPLYVSEEDMSRNIKLFMISATICIAAGGWIGNRLFKRDSRP